MTFTAMVRLGVGLRDAARTFRAMEPNSLNTLFAVCPAAVVWDRRHILDGRDDETRALQRPHGSLPARPGPGDFHAQRDHAARLCLACAILCCYLRRIGCAFSSSLEAGNTSGRPGNGVTLFIGDGDDSIVEGRVDVSDACDDALATPPRDLIDALAH